ncbi:MAG: NUDIX domain-containing protein [bacterium]
MEEYIDIYDNEGNLLGKKTRKESHENGFWHKTVHVWIINSKGEVLIQKRSTQKENNANKWSGSVGGHISAGDNEINTAIKETEEELNLKLSKEDFVEIGKIKHSATTGKYINNEIKTIYVVKMDLDLNKIKIQKEELSEVKFIKFNELKELIENKDSIFVMLPEEYIKLLFDYINLKIIPGL